MPAWLTTLLERPWIAHLLRAQERFNGRLGNQFGAALTYFSVLAMVPILMFAFATTGFVLEMRPDLLDLVKQEVNAAFSSGGTAGDKIGNFIENTLANYRAVGVFGAVTGLYAGSNWVANLKSAIRAQWRPQFDFTEQKRNIVAETLINVVHLLALLIMVLITFALASAATALNNFLLGLLGLQGSPTAELLLTIAPIVLSVGAGWLLFMFLYTVFPQQQIPVKARARGALIAAIGLGVLQYATTILVGVFSENPSFALFGPVIILMLFFNLFARLTLFVAAWIATTDQPAFDVARDRYRFDPHSRVHGPSMPPPSHRTRALGSARHRAAPIDGAVVWVPGDGEETVSQKVAAQSVRAGLGAGWLTGIATGIGLGAVVAGLAARIGRRS